MSANGRTPSSRQNYITFWISEQGSLAGSLLRPHKRGADAPLLARSGIWARLQHVLDLVRPQMGFKVALITSIDLGVAVHVNWILVLFV